MRTSLVDAIIAVARTDAKWEQFRQEVLGLPDPKRHRLRPEGVSVSDDAIAGAYLGFYCLVAPDAPDLPAHDRPYWKERFLWRFLDEASHDRCRVSGFVGMDEVKIPAKLFESLRLADNLMKATDKFAYNELTLPDGRIVTAVEVEFPDQVESVMPAAEETLPFPRPGPKPGLVARYKEPDSAFLPELEELIRSGKSKTAAATKIAERGEMAGPATTATKAKRLIELYNEKHQ